MYAVRILGIGKAAVINDGDIYTRGLTDNFVRMFETLGGEVVLNTSINKGDEQMKPVLTATLDAGAQFLFCPLFQPEGNYILLQARKMLGFEHISLMGGGALIDRSFLKAVGEKSKGMYFVGPSHPVKSITGALDEVYSRKYNTPPATSYYLSAYDAATLLFEAIEKIAVPGHPVGTVFIGRQALRDALYEMKNFKGVTGTLTCDAFGDCGQPAFDVLRMDAPAAGIGGLLLNVQFSYSPSKPGAMDEGVAVGGTNEHREERP